MQSIKFIRENGNIPKSLPGKDHVSGMLFYVSQALPKDKWGEKPIRMFGSLDEAVAAGITNDGGASLDARMMHYHLREVFRINPGVTLYVGVYTKKTANTNTFEEVKMLQNFAGGEIRQVGVWNGYVPMSASEMTALQGVANQLEEEDTPLSCIYSPGIESGKLSDLGTNYYGENKCRVSVVIGQDGEGLAATLQAAYDKSGGTTAVGGLGVVLGTVSKAAVHESIAWVSKFPAGVARPAFIDGSLYRETSRALISKLDEGRYIFFRTYNGLNGSYINDSHNLDSPLSDYCQIELVRTMDKAVRGIHTYLIPELGGPLYIDPETGKLAPETVKHLENRANKQLEDMERAGELSGWKVEIDPEQNVLSTSEVEFVIKNVPVGVFRKGRVKIGYAASV